MLVIFVHGVTVREERFAHLLSFVEAGVRECQPGATVRGFYWGKLGAALRFNGASIPGYTGARAIVSGASNTQDAQLLALLLDDPLLELAALKDEEEFDPGGAGFRPMPEAVKARNQLLAAQLDLTTASVRLGLASLPQADQFVSDVVRRAFDAAARSSRNLTALDLIDPLARSITAGLYAKLVPTVDTEADVSWTAIDAAVQQALEEHLGGQRGWIRDKAENALFTAATLALRRGGRTRLMRMSSLFVGDVITYVNRRDEILRLMDEAVNAECETTPGPVWLVGHSLGGIIAFDYCNRGYRDIERLVTVGSQVGLFGEFGSLEHEKRDGSEAKFETPAKVATWLNLFDPNDMLSFLAAPVFTRVTDIEVDTRAPFPAAHSEYWSRPDVYQKFCG